MRFEEAYEGWNGGRLTQSEAAQILGTRSDSYPVGQGWLWRMATQTRIMVAWLLPNWTPSTHDREEPHHMKPLLTDPALEYLLQSAGLTLTEAQKADLKTIHDDLTAMKARVRQKRGSMAELAHTYGFTAEDLT